MSARCPSSMALEEVLLDPASAKATPHVQGCDECKARLVQMERQGEEFQRVVYPATLAALEAPARSNFARWLTVLAPAAALATVAVLVALVPRAPSSDYVGSKGAALKLSVYAGGAASARELSDGELVRADAALRFRVQTAGACTLWIFSLDEAGTVSRLFPAAGDSGVAVQGQVTLPGGAQLDGHAGPERLYAICASEKLPQRQLEGAIRAVGAGEQQVRAAKLVQGLPEGSSQATLLLEKKP